MAARAGRVEVSLFDGYDVTARTIAIARELEALLVADQVIDPPLDDEHCLCPRYYPELFTSAAR